MSDIERRLTKIEKIVNKSNSLDLETLDKITQSPHFVIRCILYEAELRRELSDEEKLIIANRLFETGQWKISFGDVMIRAHKEYVNKQREGIKLIMTNKNSSLQGLN
jgi:hypothetical protein